MTAPRENVQQFQVALLFDEPQHPPYGIGFDVAPGQRDNLVEHREGVAHASVGLASDHAQGIVLSVRTFLGEHSGQSRNDVLYRDAPEVEALAPRKDRGR